MFLLLLNRHRLSHLRLCRLRQSRLCLFQLKMELELEVEQRMVREYQL